MKTRYLEKGKQISQLWVLPLEWNSHLPVICQNVKSQSKRKETHYIFSRPFGKHGIVPLATYYIHEHLQKGWYCNCWHCYKQASNVLAKRINVFISILNALKSQGSFLKCTEENYQKMEDTKEKGASLPCPEKHTLWEPTERSLSYWNLRPMNSWHK